MESDLTGHTVRNGEHLLLEDTMKDLGLVCFCNIKVYRVSTMYRDDGKSFSDLPSGVLMRCHEPP